MPRMARTQGSAIDYIDLIRRGGRVRRFHTVALLHPQNNAEHSYGVAGLCLAITSGDASAALLKAALHHDVTECLIGDMPRNVKMEYPELGEMMDKAEDAALVKHGLWVELTDAERKILKEADILDVMFFALDELALGNSAMQVVVMRAFEYLGSHGWSNVTNIGRMLALEAQRRLNERE